MCVISPSEVRAFGRSIFGAYTVKIFRIAVICVRKHLFLRLSWSNIVSEYMLKCVHLAVMFVTKRLLLNMILRIIKSFILRNDTCSSIMMTIHMPVICVIKVLVFGVAWQESIPTYVRCDKSFTRKSGLNRHLRLHTGERSKICDVCSHTFVDKCALKVHQAVHTE
jgi:hypothetical protein